VQLATPVSGVITQVPVQVGQRVAQGTLLVELDQRPFQARASRAVAALEGARQDHAEARRELQRTQELFDRTLLSIHDRQVAEIAAAKAQARLRSAEADLTETQVELDYSRVRAPFDAWVVALSAQVGETVVSRLQARTLVVLAPAGRQRASAWVTAGQMTGLAPGTALPVEVQGQSYPGRVSALSLEPRPGDGEQPHYRLDVDFPLPPAAPPLRPGQRALIRLP